MSFSTAYEGQRATVSPCGSIITFIADRNVGFHDTRTRDRHIGVGDTKDVQSLIWSPDRQHLALLSGDRIQVVCPEKQQSGRFVLNNGTRPLGNLVSAEFLGDGQLLVLWEFGRAKLYDIVSGKSLELGDFKTGCDSGSYAVRPQSFESRRVLAHLRKDGADDTLCLRSGTGQLLKATKLATADAQGISWSACGRWLAVLDTPASTTGLGVYFFTPDGNRFMTYPRAPYQWVNDLGIKKITWSPGADLVALSGFYGDVVLLDSRKFLPQAVLEHASTISHDTTLNVERAPIWQETVSASNERSFEVIRLPISPVVTRPKPPTDPKELGVAEVRFSSDGRFIATRDERFQSTIWIWEYGRRKTYESRGHGLHALLLQHRNVRTMSWHPTKPQSLMYDCGEGNVYLYNAETHDQPPQCISVSIPGTPTFSWIPTEADDEYIILAATKSRYCLIYPDRAPGAVPMPAQTSDGVDQSHLEDSLEEILSGRTPLPTKTEPSYTEMIDFESEAADATAGMEDTFREKRKEVDPLDDSEFF